MYVGLLYPLESNRTVYNSPSSENERRAPPPPPPPTAAVRVQQQHPSQKEAEEKGIMKKCCTCTNNGVSSGWPRAALISFRFDLKLPRGEEGRRGGRRGFSVVV